METLTAALSQTAQVLLVGIQPLLQEYLGFLLAPMVAIIALTYVTKRLVGKVKNPKRVWRIVPLVYGILYMAVLSVAKPDSIPLYGGSPIFKGAIIFGVGVLLGCVNILGYDLFFMWRKKKG